LLRKDHQTVKGLFRQLKQAGERAQQSKQKIVGEIEHELEVHATIEEEIFYPAVQSEVTQAEDLVHEAIEEHRVVRNLLSEITVLEPDDEQYDAKVKVLQENVEHHIEEEEGEMFPKVTSALAEARLLELGQEMQERKEVLGQSTLSRVISGVSNLIFGNGDEKDEEGGATEAAEAQSHRRRAQGGPAESSGRGQRGAPAVRGRAPRRASGKQDSAEKRGERGSQSRRSGGAQARAPRGGRGKAKSAGSKARGGRAQGRSAGGNARSRARGARTAQGKGGRTSGAQAKRQGAAKRTAARSRASARKQANAGKKRGANRMPGSKR
jgi:hemerythrin superfamily protein